MCTALARDVVFPAEVFASVVHFRRVELLWFGRLAAARPRGTIQVIPALPARRLLTLLGNEILWMGL
jgi:hypothetical protein